MCNINRFILLTPFRNSPSGILFTNWLRMPPNKHKTKQSIICAIMVNRDTAFIVLIYTPQALKIHYRLRNDPLETRNMSEKRGRLKIH